MADPFSTQFVRASLLFHDDTRSTRRRGSDSTMRSGGCECRKNLDEACLTLKIKSLCNDTAGAHPIEKVPELEQALEQALKSREEAWSRLNEVQEKVKFCARAQEGSGRNSQGWSIGHADVLVARKERKREAACLIKKESQSSLPSRRTPRI